MSQTMTYKGYTANIQYSDIDSALIGKVIDIIDVIGFEGQSITEITQSFHETIDGYLADCAEDGRSPDKSFSGKIITRMPTDIHRQVFLSSQRDRISINAWLINAAEEKLERVNS